MSNTNTNYKQTEIGEIPEGWEVTRLGNVASFKYGKMPDKKLISKKGYPIYSGYSYKGFYPEHNIESDKVIVVARGVGGTGDVKIVPGKTWVTNLSIILDLDENIFDKKFFRYLNYRGLKRLDSGSAQSQITIGDLKQLKLARPRINEQKEIASILSSLDDKIELNRKMNQTLEEIGKALFRQWFVDFEFPNNEGNPYKSSGGEMVDSDLGEIPKGWRVGKLQKLIEITSGKRPGEKVDEAAKKFTVPVIGASGVMGYTNKFLYKEKIITTGRVGTLGIVNKINYPCWVSDNSLVIKSQYYEYVYETLSLIDFTSLNVGSTQPLVTQTALKNLEIVIPENSIVNKFEEFTQILTKKIRHNNYQNKALKKIRDSLLPRLISGKLRVNL